MGRIDLNQILVTHFQGTFFMRASGDSMVEYGNADNNILVIKRSRRYRVSHNVNVAIDGEFLDQKLDDKNGQLKLLLADCCR